MPAENKISTNSGSSQLDLWGGKQDSHWKKFKVAREYVRSLKLKNESDWTEIVNSDKFQGINIPSNPDRVYKNHGWLNWSDWFGPEQTKEQSTLIQSSDNRLMDSLWSTDNRSKWMNFFEARQMVHEYNFEYKEEWALFIEGKFPDRETLPDNIPGNPDQVYKFVGWKDWKDWLINPEKQIDYTEFHQSREFVRSNRIPDRKSWSGFLQQKASLLEKYQMFLPVRPHLEYGDSGWHSWEDWTGSEIDYPDFKSTRRYIHSLKLKNKQEWKEFCRGLLTHKPRKTENIYTYPEIAYRDEGWSSWKDWLGAGKAIKVNPSPSKTSEIIIDCKCKGKIKDCPICDGKGFYVHIL